MTDDKKITGKQVLDEYAASSHSPINASSSPICSAATISLSLRRLARYRCRGVFTRGIRLFTHIGYTLAECVVGFIAASLLGILIAVLLWRFVRNNQLIVASFGKIPLSRRFYARHKTGQPGVLYVHIALLGVYGAAIPPLLRRYSLSAPPPSKRFSI